MMIPRHDHPAPTGGMDDMGGMSMSDMGGMSMSGMSGMSSSMGASSTGMGDMGDMHGMHGMDGMDGSCGMSMLYVFTTNAALTGRWLERVSSPPLG